MKIDSSLYFDEVDTSRPYEPTTVSEGVWLKVDPEPVLIKDLVATEEQFERDKMRRIPGSDPFPPRVICHGGRSYLVSEHGEVAYLIRAGQEVVFCRVVPVAGKPATTLVRGGATRR